MRFVSPLLVVAALLSVAGNAYPQDDPIPACKEGPPREADALAYFRVGKARYDAKEYGDAIRLFLEAYAADCSKHEVLLIVARAYELAELRLSAAVTLESYLARVPKDPEADARRLKITQLRHADKQEAATEAKSAPPPITAPPPEDPFKKALPWVVTGTGVVLLATGVNLYIVGHSNVPAGCDASSKTCSPTAPPDAPDKAGNANGLQIGGIITGVVGLAAVGGGIAWALSAKSQDAAAPAKGSAQPPRWQASATPLWGNDRGGVVSAWKTF